jgi:hypothetical protein
MISFLKINYLGDENEDEKRHAAYMGKKGNAHTFRG